MTKNPARIEWGFAEYFLEKGGKHMDPDRTVAAMALLRFLAASIEITGACLMLYFWRIQHAIRINAILGALGPGFFLLVSCLGLSAAKPSPLQLTLLSTGLLLTFLGLR
jgi:hypothetical protein